MGLLPERHELTPHSNLIPHPTFALPEQVDVEDLKSMALRAAGVALLQLVNSLQTAPSEAIKNRAAETILQIAFGKDKESLRNQEQQLDAVKAIQEAIAQAKEI